MKVTIIADASFCPDTKAAGYGFWIACARGKRGGQGAMRIGVENSTSAEMMALLNAMQASVISGLVEEGDELLVQTDCQGAIDGFTGNRQNITNQEARLSRQYRQFLVAYNLSGELRHVKGHSTEKGSRYVVNNICDKNARKHMRKARRIIEINKIQEMLKND